MNFKFLFVFVCFCFVNSYCDQITGKEVPFSQLNIIAKALDQNFEDLQSEQENGQKFVAMIFQKMNLCERISNIMLHDFLENGLSSNDTRLDDKLQSIHKIIKICYQIQQKSDRNLIYQLKEEIKTLKMLIIPIDQGELTPDSEPKVRKYRLKSS